MRRVNVLRAISMLSIVAAAASCEQLIGLDRFHDAICTPGEQKSDDCPYTGPAGTKGVGICKAGVRTCAEDGLSWGACSAPVLPMTEENCSTPEDDNCDGQVNEAAAGCCEPGAMLSCYSGPEGTKGVGLCKAGVAACGKDGKTHDACVDDVKPAPETCADPQDEDCDGHDCVEWAELFGDGAAQRLVDLALDPMGNIIASGALTGAVTFGGQTLTDTGAGDALILKLDPQGKPLWARSFGNVGEQSAGAVAVDSTGSIFFSGCSKTPFELDQATLPAGVFVAKLSADGKAIAWAKGLGTLNCDDGPSGFLATGTVMKLAVTFSNDVVLVGGFKGSIDFGAGSVQSAGGVDAFVATLRGADGSVSQSDGGWFKVFGDTEDQQANDVAIDPLSGGVQVVGEFAGSISLGTSSTSATSKGGKDIFVARFHGGGEFATLRTLGALGDQFARTVVLYGNGRYAIAGQFDGTIDFGGGPMTAPASLGVGYLAEFDADDTFRWARRYGESFAGAFDLGIDPQGNYVLSGVYQGSIDFGGGPHMATGDQFDVFLAKLDSNGKEVWAKTFTHSSLYVLPRVRTSSTGEVVMAGFTPSPIDFGSGLLTPAGSNDAFVAKFGL
ncbi:Hypothetical protein A7982_02474 [Minicystis rosea]|nr:Hypothetical protein A7982_02474 [Minicystis rosea]